VLLGKFSTCADSEKSKWQKTHANLAQGETREDQEACKESLGPA